MKKMLGVIIAVAMVCMFTASANAACGDDGLVAYYPFNGNANDESGCGNDGTVYGATLAEDRDGNPSSAYFFDGIDDYIRIAQSDTLDDLQVTTIAYWTKYYKPTSGPSDSSATISNGPDIDWNYPIGDGFFTNGFTNYISHHLGIWADAVTVDVPIDAAQPLSEQEYIYVTFVATVDKIKIYKNGQIIEEKDREGRNISRPSQDWYIGQSGSVEPAFQYFLNGYMDDIRIYDRALSSIEICELAGLTNCGGGCVPSASASTLGTSPVHESSDLVKHLAYFLLPLGAIIGLCVWRRKR